MDKGTSDERLLKIIEGGITEPKRKPNIGVSQKKSLSDLVPSAKFKALSLKAFKEFKLNLIDFNKGLIIVASMVTLFFLYSLFSGPNTSASNASFFTAADAASVAKIISTRQAPGETRKNILGQDIKRNIFLAPGAKASINSSDAPAASMTELVKDLKLVGIIWSENPEVMIEDTKDSRTYILKKGDTLRNDKLKIKDILRSSAVLELPGNSGSSEYELR